MRWPKWLPRLMKRAVCVRRIESDLPSDLWKICGRVAAFGQRNICKAENGVTFECLIPLCKEHFDPIAGQQVVGPQKTEIEKWKFSHVHVGVHANLGIGCLDVVLYPLAQWYCFGTYSQRPSEFFLGPIVLQHRKDV